MRSLTALGARIERLAAEQGGQSIGRQIVDILEGRAPGPPATDEELSRCKVGRLLLARRRRAGLADPG
jgi:hypothetical protein